MFCSYLKECFLRKVSESSLNSNVVQYALLWPESPKKFCPATGLLLCLSIPGRSVPNSSLTFLSSDRDPESSVDRQVVAVLPKWTSPPDSGLGCSVASSRAPRIPEHSQLGRQLSASTDVLVHRLVER